MTFAILGDRQSLALVLLTVVLHETDQPVAAIGTEPAEHPADIDRTVLVRIADQTNRPSHMTDVVGEAREVTGPKHRRLIDDDYRPGRQATRVPVAEVEQQAGDRVRLGAGRAREPGRTFELRGRCCRA